MTTSIVKQKIPVDRCIRCPPRTSEHPPPRLPALLLRGSRYNVPHLEGQSARRPDNNLVLPVVVDFIIYAHMSHDVIDKPGREYWFVRWRARVVYVALEV